MDDSIKITIDLGDGKSENIFVQKGEENQAHQLAEQFCQKYNFDERI